MPEPLGEIPSLDAQQIAALNLSRRREQLLRRVQAEPLALGAMLEISGAPEGNTWMALTELARRLDAAIAGGAL